MLTEPLGLSVIGIAYDDINNECRTDSEYQPGIFINQRSNSTMCDLLRLLR